MHVGVFAALPSIVYMLGSCMLGWNVEETKAADVQSQLGVVQNKTIYMKVSPGKAELGYDRNNILHGYFNSWQYIYQSVSAAGHQETIPPTPLFHLQ